MIFHIPHSSKEIPKDQITPFFLDSQELDNELIVMTDSYTDELFGSHAKDFDETIIFPISRLVVDPERFLDDKAEPMASRGMGVIYTKTSCRNLLRKIPSTKERNHLINKFYHPHHNLLTISVKNTLLQRKHALIIDCHSFPSKPLLYEEDQNPERPDICIGIDNFHTNHNLVEILVESIKSVGWNYAINQPFSGTIVPMDFYHKDNRVESIMVEINRRLYMNELTGEKNPLFEGCKKNIETIITSVRSYEDST